jgi:hypothetical protein
MHIVVVPLCSAEARLPAGKPVRVQAWWSGAELGSPTIMRNGRWLEDADGSRKLEP